ncbi:hypothetical protein V6N12_038094 [Hibiscus sabdariffa]|uniref:Uncharacterized protein n=1 Tax=Hibiscus sabdariffa TaxID=183260 RepID=A0ABR2BWJ8_9ROSI
MEVVVGLRLDYGSARWGILLEVSLGGCSTRGKGLENGGFRWKNGENGDARIVGRMGMMVEGSWVDGCVKPGALEMGRRYHIRWSTPMLLARASSVLTSPPEELPLGLSLGLTLSIFAR